jgi:hypothetical protein
VYVPFDSELGDTVLVFEASGVSDPDAVDPVPEDMVAFEVSPGME